MSLAEAEQFLASPTYPIVDLPAPFVDERGVIQNVTTSGAQSVGLLTSKAGSSRANHIHKTDDHLAVVVSGRIEYWWHDVVVVGDEACAAVGSELKHVVIEAGQAFYTPKHVAHTMYFLADTTFLTISCKARTHEEHEADLIRVPSLKASAA
jgi:dTDP-4-dehydrorhamnose 3,5-epimerase-like enzyme